MRNLIFFSLLRKRLLGVALGGGSLWVTISVEIPLVLVSLRAISCSSSSIACTIPVNLTPYLGMVWITGVLMPALRIPFLSRLMF
ncbi:hypothetical protein D3C78_1636770 [compost metagenome]